MPKIESSRKDGVSVLYAPSIIDWRQWLEINHSCQDKVWLVFFKKNTNIPTPTIGKAIEEALCFGWIDSKSNTRDDKSYYVYFSKRNPKSNWSRINKEKVQKLVDAGKMTPAGEQMISMAKQSRTWDALNDVENLIIPEDMMDYFWQVPNALSKWNDFPRSSKRAILEWIFNAKRSETRSKRIKSAVDQAALG